MLYETWLNHINQGDDIILFAFFKLTFKRDNLPFLEALSTGRILTKQYLSAQGHAAKSRKFNKTVKEAGLCSVPTVNT